MSALPYGSVPTTLAALYAVSLLAACGGGEAGGRWAGTVDTVPGGTVVVRNPAEGMWGEGEGWWLEEELRIGALEGEGPEVFGRVADLAVDALGRIYVAEGQAMEVRVFDAGGRHVRSLGRKGGGPGEFEDVSGLRWGPEGNLWVVDQRNGRYSVFDTAGVLVTSHRRRAAGMFWPWPGGFDPEGRLVDVTFHRNRTVLLRYGLGLARVDTVPLPTYEGPRFELRDGERLIMTTPVPFAPRLLWRFDPRGFVWFGIGDEYRLYQLTLDGDTARIVEREYEAVPVTAADRDSAVESLKWFTDQGGKVDPGEIPGQKPALSRFFADEVGYLWVEPALPHGREEDLYDVFDPEGRYLGRIGVPVRLDPSPRPIIAEDRIYGVHRDELDVEHVVVIRLDRRDR